MFPGAWDHLRDLALPQSQYRSCRACRLPGVNTAVAAYLSAAPSSPSFSPKLTRGADIVNSDAQVNGRGGVEI